MIGRSGERGSGISVPVARHDDDDIGCGSKIWNILGLVSLFNGISALFRLFNAEAILLEEH